MLIEIITSVVANEKDCGINKSIKYFVIKSNETTVIPTVGEYLQLKDPKRKELEYFRVCEAYNDDSDYFVILKVVADPSFKVLFLGETDSGIEVHGVKFGL